MSNDTVTRRTTYTRMRDDILLNHSWVEDAIRGSREHFKQDERGNSTFLGGSGRLGGTFVALMSVGRGGGWMLTAGAPCAEAERVKSMRSPPDARSQKANGRG